MGRKKGAKNLPKEKTPLAPVFCLSCKRLEKRAGAGSKCLDCHELASAGVRSLSDQEGEIAEPKLLNRCCVKCIKPITTPDRWRTCKDCEPELPSEHYLDAYSYIDPKGF